MLFSSSNWVWIRCLMLQAPAIAALSLGLYIVVYWEPMRCFIYTLKASLYCLNDSLVNCLDVSLYSNYQQVWSLLLVLL